LENDLNDIFLNPKEIQQWLKKHHTFYWSLQLDWNYKAFSRFQSLYFNLRYGADYLVQAATAKEAVEEYIPFDDDWLYKYDRFYYCKFSGFGSSYKVWSEDPFILEQTYQSIYLVGEEFKYLYQFSVMFEREIKIFREGDDF
jgi:hypothetical protein